MGQLTFIIGGARSGKSAYAQRLAGQHGGQIVYIATAQGGDDEMQARIAAHQKARPARWRTLEAPKDIAQAWRAASLAADVVVLDCLTLLVSNLLLEDSREDAVDDTAAARRVMGEIEDLLAIIRESAARWLVIANEVGLGLVPPYPLGRAYRDLLGQANQRLAAAADEVFLMVAGIPVPIHDYRVQ